MLLLMGGVAGCSPQPASGRAHPAIDSTVPSSSATSALKDKSVKAAPNFRLLDHLGRSHELYRQKHAKAVVLFYTGNGCPIVRKSYRTLEKLRDEFAKKGVVFWLIDGNPQDDRESVVAEAKEFSVALPILLDTNQLVTTSLGVRRTAEAIAISTSDWSIFYRGAVDNRLGYGSEQLHDVQPFLEDALNQFLAGDPIKTPHTEVKGCAITLATDTPPATYTGKIAGLLEKHCVNCHRPGDIGPFAMTSYEKVRGWSSMIREVLLEQRMPPWGADPHYGSFSNARGLSRGEAADLVNWIDAGCPRGEGDDPLRSVATTDTPIWPLGEPDLIIKIPEPQQVPATGVLPYRHVSVPMPLDRDVWIRAAEVRPSNRKVVHHAFVFIKRAEDTGISHLDPIRNGFFSAYVPNTRYTILPENTGKLIPRGCTLVFQLHYTTTGREETDQTEIGLYLRKEKPPLELISRAATKLSFEIPPGVEEYPLSAEYTFRRDALLYHLSPHMHGRGKWMKFEAVYPDGRRETLLSVPYYEYDWQHQYWLTEPKRLPAGSKIRVTGAFDNSANNPFNLDPKASVRFGLQTTDEMFMGYFHFANAPSTSN